ncbi:MAG: hypothetical protein Q9213_006437 [Squamulea squamosa]
MALNLKGRALSYAEPALFLLFALYGAALAVFNIVIKQRRPQDLLNGSKFSDQAFGAFWLMLAPSLAEREVEKGVPDLVASASGTIIEIGPGSGNQVSRYDRSKVTKIYGIEPTTSLHAKLRENIKKAGLSDVYTIVPCGAQDVQTLREYGVDKEAFDTVLSVQVFCSIPNPKETAAALWGLLKPGGTMIIYEHVKSPDFLSSKVQGTLKIFTKRFLACMLDAADSLIKLSTIRSGHMCCKAVLWTATLREHSGRPGIGPRLISSYQGRKMHGWRFHIYRDGLRRLPEQSFWDRDGSSSTKNRKNL